MTLKKNYKNSLFLRIVMVSALIILLPAVFSILYFNTEVAGYLENRARENADYYINELVDNDTSAMQMIQNIASYLLGDKEVTAVMAKKDPPTGIEQTILQDSIGKTLLYNVTLVDKYISSLFIFRNDDIALTPFRSGVYLYEYSRMSAVYHELIDQSSMHSLFMPDVSGNSCYFIVDYVNINTLNTLGKILIEVNVENMVPADSLQNVYSGTEIILSDKNGNIFAINNVQNSDLNSTEFSQFNTASNGTSGYVNWRGSEHYHRREWLEGTDLVLDIFIPREEILHAARNVGVWYSVIAIITIGLTTTIFFISYSALSKPYKQFIQKIEMVANGDFSIRLEKSRFTEIEKLQSAFNNMAANLDNLNHEAYIKGVLLRESEFKLLEAQINPHFLFNSLEAINLRCLQAGQKETSQMITDLAQLIRSNFNNKGNQKVTFEQELEYVRYYLNVQKSRFYENLKYTIEYEDPTILKYYLPKLTIQPLVENSVVHGLENSLNGGNVDIRIWEEEESVYISVADNGIGFDPSSIDESSDDSNHNHVALNNIKKRIKLLYGEKGDLLVSSSIGSGTTVIAIIPIDTVEV